MEIQTGSDTDFFDDEIMLDEDDDSGLATRQPPPEPVDGTQRDKNWGSDKRWTLFMNPRMHGLCFNPWQFLKVDVFGRSNVCCAYFGRLPKFEWLSAKEFHGPDGMWNHPFMVHMRGKSGTDEEVPYCGFCQGRYRPDLPGRTARRLAVVESQKLLQDKIDEVVRFDYAGTIDTLPEDLSEWSFPLARKAGYDWFPFKSKRQYYRRDVRMSHFQNIGSVAQLGSSGAAYAPFLAEPNNRLTVVDWQKNQLLNVAELLEALGLEGHTTIHHEDPAHLPFEKNSLDGVWLDARRWFDRVPPREMLREVRRVLKMDAKLRVVCAPGVGALTRKIVHAESPERAEELLAVLRSEGRDRGPDTYFAMETMYQELKQAGFALDKERPAQIKPIGSKWREVPHLGRDVHEVADRLESPAFRAEVAASETMLDGLEEFFTFNAAKADITRARIPILPDFSLNSQL